MQDAGVAVILWPCGQEALTGLVAGLPRRKRGFDSRSGHVEFVVNKAEPGPGFPQELPFSPKSFIPPTASLPSLTVVCSVNTHATSLNKQLRKETISLTQKKKNMLYKAKTLLTKISIGMG
jgi:hypothetical protein